MVWFLRGIIIWRIVYGYVGFVEDVEFNVREIKFEEFMRGLKVVEFIDLNFKRGI